MGEFSFPKHFHLWRPAEFRHVYSRGKKFHSRGFVLYRNSNELGYPRLGLPVGRKFGCAVKRNRIKRLIREAVRLNWRNWSLEGSDIVIIPKGRSGRYRFHDVNMELSSFFSTLPQG